MRRAGVTIPAVRLFDLFPSNPIVTLAHATALIEVSEPTVLKAISALEDAGILVETSGNSRDRVGACQKHHDILTDE